MHINFISHVFSYQSQGEIIVFMFYFLRDKKEILTIERIKLT